MTEFIFESIITGIALAMDAFSVSIANGLKEPQMRVRRMCKMAGCYAFFQFLMPLLGWFIVHTMVRIFDTLTYVVPWIGLFLLIILGVKMIAEGLKERREMKLQGESALKRYEKDSIRTADNITLLLQGTATSIDALSIGFAIAAYDTLHAVFSAVIIGGVTFIICLTGLKLGKRLGAIFTGRAGVIGGIILIGIGIKLLLG